MIILSPSRRPRRSAEWDAGKAIIFFVTLGATHSVTLAARAAGMSRKSAYALKARDPAFAAAWDAARKVPEVPRAPQAPDSGNCVRQGDKRGRSATTILSTSTLELMRLLEKERRDACLARLSERAAAIRRDSAALAARRPLP